MDMNRRGFFGAVVWAALAPFVLKRRSRKPQRNPPTLYGHPVVWVDELPIQAVWLEEDDIMFPWTPPRKVDKSVN